MKYTLASRNALETNFNKVKLFRTTPKDEFSGWVIIGDNEKKELLDESLDQFEVVDNTLVEAKNGYPFRLENTTKYEE